ncbi:MAG TPA: signal peptidase I [Gammaproteobacteria bacterium]|nr:signal peptidase I [Gammaproteobacteria bacterium]
MRLNFGFKKSTLVSEGLSLVILLGFMTMARSSLADHYYVPSGSMEYSLIPGDRIIVDKTAYGFRIPLTTIDLFGAREPKRGDVAVFDSPRDGTRLVKRIVAVGGDVVSLHGGLLTINGQPLDRPAGEHTVVEQFGDDHKAVLNLDDGGGPDITDLKIPEGMVLALGDHRGDSLDGRYWGLISEKELYGKAIAVYYRRGDGFTWRRL